MEAKEKKRAGEKKTEGFNGWKNEEKNRERNKKRVFPFRFLFLFFPLFPTKKEKDVKALKNRKTAEKQFGER